LPPRLTRNYLESLQIVQRQAFLNSLGNAEKAAIFYHWPFWARDNQLPPSGDWRVWLILAGRGFGKTRSGAELVRARVESGRWGRIALVAETAADARDVMVEGESGLLAVSPPWNRPLYEPSKRRLTWLNGAIATTYSGDDPDQLRGPQHDGAWADEPAKWRYSLDAWNQLEFGLRLGDHPQVVATTTPRPIPLIKQLVADRQTIVTRGSTYDNRPNLAQSFIERVLDRYEGTRLGQQELYAMLLDDTPGALWNRAILEATRVREVPKLVHIVVGVDPAASSDEGANETGIVVVGKGGDGHGYVLADRTVLGSPVTWAKAALHAYATYQADRIVVERNNGGEMVEHTIRTTEGGKDVPIQTVWASRGKYTRAEPVSALYEQGRFHHVGMFAQLEDQQCGYVPGVPGMDSPDRMDAMVWAATALFPNVGTPPQPARSHSYVTLG
jgi:phage terminase large subunit-like protein